MLANAQNDASSKPAPPTTEERVIDLGRVEGRLKTSTVKKIGEIVDKHPGEALTIIRNWLHQEG